MKTFFPKVIFFQIIFRLSLFYNDYCQKSQNVILHQKKQRQYNAKQIITTLYLPKSYIIFPQNPSSLADVAWGLNIVFSALNIVQRPQHRFLAKLWHKNDVFDEKKGVWGS